MLQAVPDIIKNTENISINTVDISTDTADTDTVIETVITALSQNRVVSVRNLNTK